MAIPNDWRDIPGFGGVYQISRQGEVRTWRKPGKRNLRLDKPRLMTPQFLRKDDGVHYYVQLRDENGGRHKLRIRKLMVDIYMGGLPEGMCSYPKNGDPRDCCIHNIGFAPRREVSKKFRPGNCRPVAKIDSDGNVLEFYPSVKAAGRANFMSETAVRMRCRRKIEKPFESTGFSFKYDR